MQYSTIPNSDTTRSRGEGEIDGSDYNFVSRSQFEEYVAGRRFVEHGEFDRQLYGTSLDSVRTVINSGKICVLNLQPASLQILHDSDIKPYVVFLTPPSVQTYRQIKARYGGDAMKVSVTACAKTSVNIESSKDVIESNRPLTFPLNWAPHAPT